jgi:hypothetical protein
MTQTLCSHQQLQHRRWHHASPSVHSEATIRIQRSGQQLRDREQPNRISCCLTYGICEANAYSGVSHGGSENTRNEQSGNSEALHVFGMNSG